MLHGLWTPVPDPGIGPTPLHWKRGILTTGPPEKPPNGHVLTNSSASIISSGKNELVLPLRWRISVSLSPCSWLFNPFFG